MVVAPCPLRKRNGTSTADVGRLRYRFGILKMSCRTVGTEIYIWLAIAIPAMMANTMQMRKKHR